MTARCRWTVGSDGQDKHNVDPTACLMRSRERSTAPDASQRYRLTSNVVIRRGNARFELPGQEEDEDTCVWRQLVCIMFIASCLLHLNLYSVRNIQEMSSTVLQPARWKEELIGLYSNNYLQSNIPSVRSADNSKQTKSHSPRSTCPVAEPRPTGVGGKGGGKTGDWAVTAAVRERSGTGPQRGAGANEWFWGLTGPPGLVA